MMNKLFANREMRILMLGLDAAGKTSNNPIPSQFIFLLSCGGGCDADDRCSDFIQVKVESTVRPLLNGLPDY
jgi:ADP-ribosylation factor family